MAEFKKSLQGQLLLDGGKLQGSFFHRTVVLVCQHDANGAFGLVLNRAMDNTVGEMIIEDMPDQLREQPLYLGGPVQPNALSYLHGDTFIPDANVLNNVNLGHALEELVDISESFSADKKLRVFAGYAGWSPAQLDGEMEREAWLTHPASPDLIFQSKPEDLWHQILREKGWPFRLLADSPDDISWN